MSNKKIYILGICGTFMAGIARIAKQMGFKVSGADKNVYPPMSDQILEMGIAINDYDDLSILEHPNLSEIEFVIGNIAKRGDPLVEEILIRKLNYTSGPAWLAHNVLKHKIVLAVAGTHGKTTTSTILAWILEKAEFNPSFLIGGVGDNFGVSARLTASKYFVIEADEYDTAFFDKRSKFVHYGAEILIINNLEYDHADIFGTIEDIYYQFHLMLRTLSEDAKIILPKGDENIESMLQLGCWSKLIHITNADRHSHDNDIPDYYYQSKTKDCSHFELHLNKPYQVNTNLVGRHNMQNLSHAITAAILIGIEPNKVISSLSGFAGIKRRLTNLAAFHYDNFNLEIIEDFAHHPTAIKATLEGLVNKIYTNKTKIQDNETKDNLLIVVFDPRSNTMRLGVHNNQLLPALDFADYIYIHCDFTDKLPHNGVAESKVYMSNSYSNLLQKLFNKITSLISQKHTYKQVQLVFMSNGSFDNLPRRLISKLREQI